MAETCEVARRKEAPKFTHPCPLPSDGIENDIATTFLGRAYPHRLGALVFGQPLLEFLVVSPHSICPTICHPTSMLTLADTRIQDPTSDYVLRCGKKGVV